MPSSNFLSVDTKVRKSDWAATHPDEDDLALESWSVVESRVIGWTRNEKKRTDYVLWFWKDTGRWCLLPFRFLCKVFQDNWEVWRDEHRTEKQFTPARNGRAAYHSECVFVPRKEIWAEMYKHFSGMLVTATATSSPPDTVTPGPVLNFERRLA